VGHLQTKFERASRTYENHSEVQREMAVRLVSLIPACRPRTILELACGTGHLTLELARRFPAVPLMATDLSEGMLLCTRQKLEGVVESLELACMDAAEVDLCRADLIGSNALVQWFPELDGHLRKVAIALNPGGHYAFSGFCNGNFPELNGILAAPPFEYREFPGHTLETAASAARAAGFEVLHQSQHVHPVIYPSVRDFLDMLKSTGAVRSPEKPFSRSRALTLLRELEKLSSQEGFTATWMPWFLILRKP
jgi:malonyl-CoA O-methyltransferase